MLDFIERVDRSASRFRQGRRRFAVGVVRRVGLVWAELGFLHSRVTPGPSKLKFNNLIVRVEATR